MDPKKCRFTMGFELLTMKTLIVDASNHAFLRSEHIYRSQRPFPTIWGEDKKDKEREKKLDAYESSYGLLC